MSAISPTSTNRYVIEVEGDSMIEAGIHDGDLVIIHQQDTAEPGDIVVALIDSQEVTLKKLGPVKNGMVTLIPANRLIPTMAYAADRVTIQGVLAGQVRKYV